MKRSSLCLDISRYRRYHISLHRTLPQISHVPRRMSRGTILNERLGGSQSQRRRCGEHTKFLYLSETWKAYAMTTHTHTHTHYTEISTTQARKFDSTRITVGKDSYEVLWFWKQPRGAPFLRDFQVRLPRLFPIISKAYKFVSYRIVYHIYHIIHIYISYHISYHVSYIILYYALWRQAGDI